MRRRASTLLALALVAGGLILVAGGFFLSRHPAGQPVLLVTPSASATPQPTLTEPILPPPPTVDLPTAAQPGTSPSPDAESSVASLPSGTPTRLPDPGPATAPAEEATPLSATPQVGVTAAPAALYTLRQRVGAGSGVLQVTPKVAGLLRLGWYLDWSARPANLRSAEVSYMPMIRLRDGQIMPSGDALLAAVDALPGALWLIGNEPDVKWQDNVPPETYAHLYHDLYSLLKARDPTCQVAIGGISQPTPLRLRYLDRILEAYRQRYGQEMPVDVWNVHNFVLREERDSWGVGIPPGMDDVAGRLYEIADHDDVALFRQQLVEFRRWMKERGLQDRPLIITEYGILMPPEYGFPSDVVRHFMLETFEVMRTLADPALGYAADGGRLVQRWCWFSVQDDRYPTGDLVQPGGDRLTALGEAFAAYVASQR